MCTLFIYVYFVGILFFNSELRSCVEIFIVKKVCSKIFSSLLRTLISLSWRHTHSQLSLTHQPKETRIYNGEKTVSSISGGGKTGQFHVKE